MKRLIIILGLLLVTLIGAAQVQQKINNFTDIPRFVPDVDTTLKINIILDQDPNVNGWTKYGKACSGCPSFFYRIQRTVKTYIAEDGVDYYYFYFYFFSNSYYSNGSPASTYLQGIDFYANQVFYKKIDYLLLNIGVSVYGAWMRSEDPNCIVKFEVTQMTVY